MHTLLLGDVGVQWGDFIFYLLLFVIMMLIVQKFAWGPVTKIMDERATKISNDIDSAAKARKDAENLLEQRNLALQDSRIEAANIITKAKKNGNKQKEDIIENTNREIEIMKMNAIKDIQKKKSQAFQSIKNDVVDISIEIASKIIQKDLSPEDNKKLIDSCIEELGKNKNE